MLSILSYTSIIMHPHSFLILLAPATAFAASVHQQRDLSPAPASSLPSGWSYAGCAIDKVVPRSLASASTYSDDMTAAKCISFCSAQGYNVAGTEYGSECYCGLTIPSPAPAEAECNKPCAGDASQACGAGYRLSLYSNPGVATVKINPGTSGWTSLGCVADAASPRTLSDFTAVQGAMTVEGCIAACQAGSYSFAGLEVCFATHPTSVSLLSITTNHTDTFHNSTAANAGAATHPTSNQPTIRPNASSHARETKPLSVADPGH